MRRLTLPLPPSANRYWRRGRNGVLYVSAEAVAYKQEVGYCCIAEGYAMPTNARVALSIEVYMRYENKGDLDNLAKVAIDAMQGHLYVNDSQIWQLCLNRHFEKGRQELLVAMDYFEELPDKP